LLSYNVSILTLSLAVGLVCSTTISLECLYAQENPPEGGGLIPDGELSSGGGGEVTCPSGSYESNGECFAYESDGPPGEEQPFVPGVEFNNTDFGPPVIPDPAKQIIDPVKEKFADPEGLVEDTFSTINENSPLSPLLIIGIVAVVAIGAGIASFARRHHDRSHPSVPAQRQVQQDYTKKDQLYEDVQVVTQGGIEEV